MLLLHILMLLPAMIPGHCPHQLMHAAAVAEYAAGVVLLLLLLLPLRVLWCCCCCYCCHCVPTWSSVRMTMKLGLRLDGSALCAAAVTTLDTKAAQAEHDRGSRT
jgi:hypothetical protein